MSKNLGLTLVCIVLVASLATACKPKSSAGSANPSGYFKTSFQDESRFIVESVVSDLAEQMFYAKYHRLPDQNHFSVIAREEAGTPVDTAKYEVQVRMDSKHAVFKLELNLDRPIWSPAIYQAAAEGLAQAIGLDAGNTDKTDDNTSFLSSLTGGSAETIERENYALSGELESDFTNPILHEKAAALLGAFTLRDHSGFFYEIRLPLSRMTAHLTMACFLGGTNTYGVNGQMAEAMLLTLTGNQVLALKRLDAIGTNDAASTVFVRALRTRNTGDYRLLGDVNGLTRIEGIEWFSAMSDWIGAPTAWPKLNDVQQQTIDFVRSAYQEGYSVEMGHELLAVAIPLEMQEISTVYELSHQEKLKQARLVQALNELPERCFTKTGGTVHVRVIGWGQWANFLQRHLCHAIQQDFNLLQNMWGVPDDAKEFAIKCNQSFGELRLYPFVRLINSIEIQSFHQSMAAASNLTVAVPQLVPAGCWDWLYCHRSFAPPFPPDYDPHVNDWFVYNPPLGTAYDLGARLLQPTLVDRSGALAFIEKLRNLAPCDCRLINFVLEKRYNNHPTYEQAMGLYSNMLPYSVSAILKVASTVKDQPDKYESLMLRAAALSPAYYYELAQFALEHHDEDKAAQYYDKGCDSDPDRVGASYHAEWRVHYYLKRGQIYKAREIADEAGEVYSAAGLEAKAFFFEATSNYDQAFEWYAKDEERYDDSSSLINFCVRYKNLTGDHRFDVEAQKRLNKLFPKGMEKVSLNDFQSPPADGAVFNGQSDLLTTAGLKKGDVVVAVYGIRVHNFQQYSYGREVKNTPELDLIVWQEGVYREFKTSPPRHRFGVDMGDYTSK